MAIANRLRCYPVWLLCLLVLGAAPLAHAQLRVSHVAHDAVVAGEPVGLFLAWEGDVPLAGLRIDVPPGWMLESVRIPDPDLTQQTRLAPIREDGTDRWQVDTSGMRVARGTTLFLRLRAGRTDRATVRVAPTLMRRGERADRDDQSAEVTWSVATRPHRAANRSLRLDRDQDPAPGYLARRSLFQGSWTASLWMRTAQADGILWSSWSGDEKVAYPFEMEIDPNGRLAAFTGNGQRHYGMRSLQPVADGAWRHVVMSWDAAAARMRLYVDGQAQDSLSLPVSMASSWRSGYLKVGARASADADVASFGGEVDELHLFDRVLSSKDIASLGRQGEAPGVRPAWEVHFGQARDAPSDREERDLDVVPSLLSFRAAPSDIRIEVEEGGLRLSFVSDDPGALRFVIERSLDGTTFQRVATLVPLAGETRLAWMDRAVPQGVIHYRVVPIYADGPGDGSPAIKAGLGQLADLSTVILEGNFPNPFNPTTTIRFEVLEPQMVRVSVWDLSGQMVAALVDGHHAPGRYQVGFQADSLPTGTYFVRMESGTGIQTHQMILMK